MAYAMYIDRQEEKYDEKDRYYNASDQTVIGDSEV